MYVEFLKTSLHPNGRDKFSTFLIKFPKCLLAELNTHRQLVRNTGSSRAIPVEKYIRRISDDPFIPQLTLNQPGMSGKVVDDETIITTGLQAWSNAMKHSFSYAYILKELGIHKQVVNRLLEPFTYVPVLLSGTEFNHFFNLRDADNVDPNFRVIAAEMHRLYNQPNSTPTILNYGDWHLPFSEFIPEGTSRLDTLKISTARNARTSYLNHEGNHDVEKDFKLHDTLLTDRHLTPFEHCSKVVDNDLIMPHGFLQQHIDPKLHANLFYDQDAGYYRWTRQYAGFYTYRHHIEDNKLNDI